MCPPTYYTVRDVKNPFMKPDTRIDSAAAARQWTALGDTFARLGVDVQTIEAIEDFEDMVFTANQVFVGTGTAHSLHRAQPNAPRIAPARSPSLRELVRHAWVRRDRSRPRRARRRVLGRPRRFAMAAGLERRLRRIRVSFV